MPAKVYLDTNVFIRAFEGTDELWDGNFGLDYQSPGQSWSGKTVQTVGLVLDAVKAAAEHIHA